MGINYYFIRAVYSWPEIKDNPTFPVRGDSNEWHLNPDFLCVTHIKQLQLQLPYLALENSCFCDIGHFSCSFRWLGWHSTTLLLMCPRWQSDKNGSKLYKTHAFEEKDISRPLLSLSSCRGWRTGWACTMPSSPPSAISPFSSCSSCPQWCPAGHGGCIFTFLLSMLATLHCDIWCSRWYITSVLGIFLPTQTPALRALISKIVAKHEVLICRNYFSNDKLNPFATFIWFRWARFLPFKVWQWALASWDGWWAISIYQ